MTTIREAVQPQSRGALRTRVGILPVLLAISLVLTGASGLIYQVVWFRLLGLVFGVTVVATSAVLAAFMAGLALGSLIAAQYADRFRNPLRVYGVAEFSIGVLALLSLPAIGQLQPLYKWLALSVSDSTAVISPIRFVLACVIMLAPTTLMGMTLPLVVRALVQRSNGLARSVSALYAANTLGAIAGAFLAGFYFIGIVGTSASAWIAAGLNIAIGLLWIAVATTSNSAAESPAVAGEHPAMPSFTISPRLAKAVLIAYALSGFTALAYEVVWTRVLAGVFPVTVYAFTLMLCAILAGIAIGSWLITPLLHKRANWPLVFVLVELGIAACAVLSVVALGRAYWLEGLVRPLVGSDAILLTNIWFMASYTLLALLPASILMGVLFPIATMVYAAAQQGAGKSVGAIYGANVLGGIGGSLLAGLVLLPLLGSQWTLMLLVAGNVVAGLIVLAGLPLGAGRRIGIGLAPVAAAVAAALVTPNIYHELSATDPRGERIVWSSEGPDATVLVVRGEDEALGLRINSHGDGEDRGPVLNFHQRLGHFGPLLHPDPHQILIVGLGVGATPGASAVHPGINLTIVELIRGVVDAAPWFAHASFDVLHRPNVDLQINDGRNYLLLTSRKFDIIESDPILPTNAGAANLYSADYYRLVRGALNPHGVMVQWIDPSLPEYSYKLMLRTFLSVFPNATLWQNGAILVGSVEPLDVPRERLEQRMSDPAVAQILRDNGLNSPDDILRGRVAGPDEIAWFVGNGPVTTDEHPYIEYFRTLPSDGTIPDLRWLPAAHYLSMNGRQGDAIIYSDESFQRLMTKFPLPAFQAYVPPPAGQASADEVNAAVKKLLATHERVWFVVSPISERDKQLESLLDQESTRLRTEQAGLVPLALYGTSK